MSEHNIVVKGGTSVRLPTAGKYCDRDIIVTAEGGGGIDQIVVTGDCSYRFAKNGWNALLDKCVTEDITNATYMFQGTTEITEIPFEINCKSNTTIQLGTMFSGCSNLETIPKINNCKPSSMVNMFYNCYRLRNLPNNIESWFISNKSSASNQMFSGCSSIREIPVSLWAFGSESTNYHQSCFYYGCSGCYVLNELIDIPVPYTSATWTSNAFSSFLSNCFRLKNLTFALNNGAPVVMKWKSQIIDLSSCGCGNGNEAYITTGFNSGITADKKVTDDATYQALKNDPDWYTHKIEYSRYNHDSAVATINSLPDTSAYLATAGGTNTIKFKGASGSATDGGAINTLTEAEIAVATAKGWTVTLS